MNHTQNNQVGREQEKCKCGAPYKHFQLFCGECGRKHNVCNNCGHERPNTKKHCHLCGEKTSGLFGKKLFA